MGSVPFSSMNLTTRRLSNTLLETGDRTGSSGTSLQTVGGNSIENEESTIGVGCESMFGALVCEIKLTRADKRHFRTPRALGRHKQHVI